MASKPAHKTPSDTPMRVPAHGRGALRVGGTNKGGPGRPPNSFKNFLAKLRADPEFQREIEEAAKDRDCRGFSSALKLVTEYDDEKPAEKKQIVGPVEVVVRFAREGRRVTAS